MTVSHIFENKICNKCETRKPLEDFYSKNRNCCKDCERLRARNWHRRNIEHSRTKRRLWRIRNIDRVRQTQREWNDRLREDVFNHYGNMCCCCGEDEKQFLSIDHTDNNGNSMREVHGMGSNMYAWLRNNNYPTGFQTLCMNCNSGKARNHGVCPHSNRRSS